ncbi:MAG: hypothetical protein AB8E15_04770 [Bdellovibrionales bacterium]
MKSILSFCVFVLSINIQAGCPDTQDSFANRLYSLITTMEGEHNVGRCRIIARSKSFCSDGEKHLYSELNLQSKKGTHLFPFIYGSSIHSLEKLKYGSHRLRLRDTEKINRNRVFHDLNLEFSENYNSVRISRLSYYYDTVSLIRRKVVYREHCKGLSPWNPNKIKASFQSL